MVPYSGASVRPHKLRRVKENRKTDHKLKPLNVPEPVHVEQSGSGAVRRIRRRGQYRHVLQTIDRWRIDDEWWRVPISRIYYVFELQGGVVDTFYRDLIDNRWYRQRDVR